MSSRNKNKISYPNSESTQINIANRMDVVCQCLDELYDVNCGGCCYIAYCLAKLLKRDNINYSVVVLSETYEDLENCDFLEDISETCTHYGIAIGGLLINVGELNTYKYIQYFDNPNPKEIKEHYETGYWNECYDVNKNDFIWKTLKNFYYDITQDLRE